MRTLIAIVMLVSTCAAIVAASEAGQNRPSPHETVRGIVDGAQLTITYGRPYMSGRAIFGALVPYGRVWCPCADEATTLDSTKPLRIDSLDVPAGPHTIWMLPTAGAWTLIVSREPTGFHTRYDPTADLGRVVLHKQALANSIEQLTFAIDRTSPSGGAAIRMMWEQTEVWAPVHVLQF